MSYPTQSFKPALSKVDVREKFYIGWEFGILTS